MKIGAITCMTLGALCIISAAVIVKANLDDPEAKIKEIRNSITLCDNKKMYIDAADRYRALMELDPENYDYVAEYRDYCSEHDLETECIKACQKAIQLKEKMGEADYTSSKLYLEWLSNTGSHEAYSFAKKCVNKFSGEEKMFFTEFYDNIKGDYNYVGGRYTSFFGWHNNCVYQNSRLYYGDEVYTFADDRDGNSCVISKDGAVLLTASEIVSYSFKKNLVAAHHEDQLVYLNVNDQRKIVPYDEKENKLLDYDYLGSYYKNTANFSDGGKWGYINANADILTDRYEYATPLVNGVGAVKYNGKWQFMALVDNKFTALDEELFDDVKLDEYGSPFSYGYAYVKKSGSEKWSLVALEISEKDGHPMGIRRVGSLEFDDVKPFGIYGAAKLDGKWGFLDAQGAWALEPSFDNAKSMICGLAPVEVGGEWGYADITGKIIIEPTFEGAVEFNPNGYAAVKIGGVWRAIRLREYNK